MNTTTLFLLREDSNDINNSVQVNDVRVSEMARTLREMKKNRNRGYAIQGIRSTIPKLFNLTFRGHCDSNILKAKGTWTEKPTNWPEHIYFGDPNNKGSKNGTKPKEDFLRPMFTFLVDYFYKMYPQYNQELLTSLETTSGFMSEENSLLSYQEVAITGKVLRDFDENNVISTFPAQSQLHNSVMDAMHKKLNEHLLQLTEHLDKQQFSILANILNKLLAMQKYPLMQIFGIVLQNIESEGYLSNDTSSLISNNFGSDFIDQKVAEVGTDEPLIELKEADLEFSIFGEDYAFSLPSDKILFEEDNANAQEQISEQAYEKENQLLENNNLDSDMLQYLPYLPSNVSNKPIYQTLNQNDITDYNLNKFENTNWNLSVRDASVRNIGVQARLINESTHVPMVVHNVVAPMVFANMSGIGDGGSIQMSEESMEVENEHNYGSNRSFQPQIPVVVEEFDDRVKCRASRWKKGD